MIFAIGGIDMIWWQSLIISVTSVAVGALLGYLLSWLGAKIERDSTKRRQLLEAMQGLFAELGINLKLIEKQPDGLLPRLTKDMWNIHKSKIAELPLHIQENIYQAYSSIEQVNAVVDNMYAFGSRSHYGPGAWDTRYENEAKKAREPLKKARYDLKEWLREQRK
jgi:hypothetical protein